MQTGQSPAVSRYPAAAYPVPYKSGWHLKSEPVGDRLYPGARHQPAWSLSWPDRQLIPGPFRFGPAQGPESACLSQIRRDCLLADGSRDDWYIFVAGQTHETCENSPQFPRFPRQPGHLRSTLYYLLHRTAPDSSSGSCSSQQSNPTTSVSSPPLPRKINPRSRAPNCCGDGGINTIWSFKSFY